ncbi:MAG: hypothetical protein QOD74_1147 [Variibacter sp.]|nr:hypothetical protein [Variibacter sp.]
MRLIAICSVAALLASTATISGMSDVVPEKARAFIRASAEAASETAFKFDTALLRPTLEAFGTFHRADDEADGADEAEDEELAEGMPGGTRRAALDPDAMCQALLDAAAQHGLPPGFFVRLIWQESRFNPTAVSRAGAQGVAQFMPATAAERGIDPLDPAQALPASAQFLSELRKQFGGNLGLAAAAYNAGARRIQKWVSKRGRLPKETRHYVSTITGVAPERWLKAKPLQVSFQVPERAPCKGLDDDTAHELTTSVPGLTRSASEASSEAKPRNAALRAATHARGSKKIARAKAAPRVASRAAKHQRHAAKSPLNIAERKQSRKIRVARAGD